MDRLKLFAVLLLIVVPVFVWWPVVERTGFFMEDFYFLRLTDVHLISDFFTMLVPEPGVIYRPLSQQVMFYFMQKLFGVFPRNWALMFFVVHIINGMLVAKLLEGFLKDKLKALLLAGVFVNSAVFFTGLYSIVTSHFLVGLMFGLLTMMVWLREDLSLRLRVWSSLGWFVLAILSSEYTLVLIPVMLMLRNGKKEVLGLIPHGIVAVLMVGINYLWAGERNEAFAIHVGAILSLLKWYVLRGLGLPEGVRNGDQTVVMVLYGLAAVAAAILIVSIRRHWQGLAAKKYELGLYGLWVVGGCLPFLLLPNHLNAVYFGIALVGFLALVGTVVDDKKLLMGLSVAMMVMGFLGVRLLLDTHWMVRRSELVRQAMMKAEIVDNRVRFVADTQTDLDELKLVMYGDLGPKVVFRNSDLMVEYEVAKKY